MIKLFTPLILLVILLTSFLLIDTNAYVYSGYKWPGNSLTYKVNTSSINFGTAALVLADIQTSATTWTTSTSANWNFIYGGTTNIAGLINDGTNAVFVNSGTSPNGYIAETNCWIGTGSVLVDCDIKIWSGTYTFYTTSETCTSQTSVTGVMTHEFGHMLALLHSMEPLSTMAVGIGPCDDTDSTLEFDDISAIQNIYGNIATPPPIPSPSPTPTPVPIPPPIPSEGYYLSVRAYKVKGTQKADLTWGGLETTTADIYRFGARIVTGTPNDGFYTDPINKKGGAAYEYKVCERASTENCTNTVRIQF